MRSLVLIGILAVLTPAGSAAEKLTVAQLEQVVAEFASKPHDAPKAQKKLAPDEISIDLSDGQVLDELDQQEALLRRIESIELADRMSTLTLYRLVGKYNLGPHVQQALEQLADRSALLKLPLGEQLHQAPPDAAAQLRMLAASRLYLVSELTHLPNFIATETTTRFDNSPVALKYLESMTDATGFHRVDISKREISFRDGKEVVDAGQAAPHAGPMSGGLDSRGEFGAEAAVVLSDMEKGTAVFDHWEQTMGGPAAVFRYAVPRESSHYEVTDECKEQVSFHDTPAYAGELAVDPKSGAILRMTLETESKPGDPVTHVASVVEYGPVVLGSRRSICPLRSLTFMVEEVNGCAQRKKKLQKPLAMINQTIFSNYHRFGSSMTLIVDGSNNGHSSSPPSTEKTPAAPDKGLPAGSEVSGPSRRQ